MVDIYYVSFEFGNKMIIWEGLSWFFYGLGGSCFGCLFYGEEWVMLVFDFGY